MTRSLDSGRARGSQELYSAPPRTKQCRFPLLESSTPSKTEFLDKDGKEGALIEFFDRQKPIKASDNPNQEITRTINTAATLAFNYGRREQALEFAITQIESCNPSTLR